MKHKAMPNNSDQPSSKSAYASAQSDQGLWFFTVEKKTYMK